MSNDRYVGFYPGKWRNSLTRLSLEAEGLMIRMCAYRWDAGKLVPADYTLGGKLLGLHRNKYEKYLKELINAGEVRIEAGYVVNDRAEASHDRAEKAVSANSTRREVDKRQERQPGDNTLVSPPVIPPITRGDTPPVTPLVNTEKTQQLLRERAGAFRQDKTREEVSTPKAPKGASDEMPDHVKPIKSWSQAFTPPDEHPKVTRSETGAIQLVNGNRQRWLDEFGGDTRRLDLALIEITGEINPGSRTDLVADVERRLARKVAAKLDQDQRYQSAVTANAASKSTTGPFGRPKIDLAKLTKSA